GIELIRRDGCVAAQRILEGTIDALFGSNDLSLVKRYVLDQVVRVLQGDVPIHELVIAKEARMQTYSGRMLPAHAKVAADGMAHDRRAEPEHGERVPYIVVGRGPRARLLDRAVPPQALLDQPHLQPDYLYYVDKQIAPALDRILGLVGVDVRSWISGMPHRPRPRPRLWCAATDGQSSSESSDDSAHSGTAGAGGRAGPSHTYRRLFRSRICAICEQVMPPGAAARASPVCSTCVADAGAAARAGAERMGVGRQLRAAADECAACAGGPRPSALTRRASARAWTARRCSSALRWAAALRSWIR
ncbi:hypothetical protein H4R21_002653, partial [Coemansia helicoidea]